MGKGKGKGYSNILNTDPMIHSMSARGIKSRVKAVPKLDLLKYMGRWYQVKAFPAWFQRGCGVATADYKLIDDVVNIVNTCFRDGRRQMVVGKAYPVNKAKSKFEVDFVGGRIITGDYWVLFVDKGYQTVLVGTPDRKYLWILSRKPMISETKEQKAISIAKRMGYDITKLR